MNKLSWVLLALGALGTNALTRDLHSLHIFDVTRKSDGAARFVGTWELVSTEYTMKDGSKRPYPDVGKHGRGYLVYTSDGHMCAQLVNPDRPVWKDAEHPTAAEKVASMDGLSAYCGRFAVDEVRHVMTHYPEIAWKPNFEGTTQPRPYAFENDLLTFSDKEEEEPGALRYSIVWRRVATKARN
jgi:hypothetical protein